MLSGDKVSLKHGSFTDSDEILINLKWNSEPKNHNALFKKLGLCKGIDLDLGCFYELKNGKKGVIQALDEFYGSLKKLPYISLDFDDRTGMSDSGENLKINGSKISSIKRIVVFAFIYKGVAHWKQADATVTVKYPGADALVIKMDSFKSRKKMCGLLLFENIDDETFGIEKIMKFYSGHSTLDRAFDWGLSWKHGRK